MIKKIIYGIVGITAFIFSGCSSEESMEEWRPIAVEAEGVVLTSSVNGFLVSGVLSPQGGTYTFTPKSDSESRIQSVNVNGKSFEVDYDWSSGIVAGETVCSGDWGEITYLNEEFPYEFGVTVNGNISSTSRKIEINVTGVYEKVTIELAQGVE